MAACTRLRPGLQSGGRISRMTAAFIARAAILGRYGARAAFFPIAVPRRSWSLEALTNSGGPLPLSGEVSSGLLRSRGAAAVSRCRRMAVPAGAGRVLPGVTRRRRSQIGDGYCGPFIFRRAGGRCRSPVQMVRLASKFRSVSRQGASAANGR